MTPKRRGKLGIKTGARALENKLKSKSKELAEDFSPLLPHGCEKYFAKEQKVLASIQRFSDDKKMLHKLSRKGDKLGRAYAGMLSLRLSDNIPGIAVFRLPHGEASVSMTGDTQKDKLIGVQHFDDPVLRLYSVQDLAKKRKIYIYSSGSDMYCSGREPSPPKDFMYNVLREEGFSLVKKEGQSLCPHLDRKWGPNLWIRFLSNSEGVRLCSRCMKDDRNTAMIVLRRIAGRKVETDIEAKVDLGITWEEENHGGYHPVTKRYIQGLVSDKKAFDSAQMSCKHDCLSKGLHVAGGKGFCTIEEMLDSVEGSEEEKIALAKAIDGYQGGIMAEEATANSILAEIWDERGLIALEAVTKDKDLARRLYSERDLSDKGPGQIISEALFLEKRKETVSGLPSYRKLGPVMSFADEVSRAYRMDGKRGLLHHIRNSRIEETRIKSLSYAFLLSIEEDSGSEWKYSETEREFALYLKDFAKRLLECPDEEHKAAMEALAQASGSGEVIS